MDGLRWLLLLFGLLVVAGVYLYSRRERDRRDSIAKHSQPVRLEPSLHTGSAVADINETEPIGATGLEREGDAALRKGNEPGEPLAEEEPSTLQQKIVTVRLVAKRHAAFAGDDLILNLRAVGMRHGKFGIFHSYEGSNEERIVFSAASLVEPGSFDLENVKHQKIPGISLFMVLPGPLEGAKAFDSMMEAGRALSKALNAELLDESGSTLSIQRQRYLREEIIQYQLGIKVA